MLPNVKQQPQLDSFLNLLNVSRGNQPNGLEQNDKATAVNQDNEFDMSAVVGRIKTYNSFDTSSTAPEVDRQNAISSRETSVAAANGENCEPNEDNGSACEKTINLRSVKVETIDLTAECDTSSTSNASFKRGAKSQTSVERPKRKNAYEGGSSLGQSSKKRKIDADWAPVRDRMDGKYHCEICEYATIRRNDLMKHNRVHSGERPFKCRRCAKAFTRKQP